MIHRPSYSQCLTGRSSGRAKRRFQLSLVLRRAPLNFNVSSRTIAAKNRYSRQLSAAVQPPLNSPIK